GDYWQKFAGLRAFFGYWMAHPGKKLLFMGAEIGQWNEWHSNQELDWYLLQNKPNQQLHQFFKDANAFYRKTKELWEVDFDWTGFEWLVPDDNQNNVVIFLRKDKQGHNLLCAVNFSPNRYDGYRVGVPDNRQYVPVFNTDSADYGGEDFYDAEPVPVEEIPSHGKDPSVCIKLPPFGGVFLRGVGKLRRKRKTDPSLRRPRRIAGKMERDADN
ncbi:MAG: alpha amylase C-terminal domain-containing protein, partial [Oscillibacter sp.]|nr:alpha amylase C-terminal domain-containing protein [Oscillibacter sp.]